MTGVETPGGGRLRRWRARSVATALLLHSKGVILDVETTDLDGRICEIALVETTGRVLLDTLVNPQTPIAAAAGAVHGITDTAVASAPTWDQLATRVDELLAGRWVAAYNVPFDRGILAAEMHRIGRTLPGARRWLCLMRMRAAAEGREWQALEGGHRALGDCLAALAILEDLALGIHPSREGGLRPGRAVGGAARPAR